MILEGEVRGMRVIEGKKGKFVVAQIEETAGHDESVNNLEVWCMGKWIPKRGERVSIPVKASARIRDGAAQVSYACFLDTYNGNGGFKGAASGVAPKA